MPHSNCIQSGCRLSFVQNSLGLEPPKFAIGDRVRSVWVDGLGGTRIDCGNVVGVFPAPDGFLAGWWYVVRFDVLTGCEWMPRPCDDDIHESDLELQPENDPAGQIS